MHQSKNIYKATAAKEPFLYLFYFSSLKIISTGLVSTMEQERNISLSSSPLIFRESKNCLSKLFNKDPLMWLSPPPTVPGALGFSGSRPLHCPPTYRTLWWGPSRSGCHVCHLPGHQGDKECLTPYTLQLKTLTEVFIVFISSCQA